MSRLRRALARSLLVLAVVAVGGVLIALVVLQTPFAKERLRDLAVRLANDRLNGTLTIGRLDGSLFWDAELQDVRLEQNGDTVIAIDRVRLEYKIGGLLGRDLVFDRLTLDTPKVRAVRSADGWNLAHLIEPSGDTSANGGPLLTFGAIVLDNGSVAIEHRTGEGPAAIPRRISNLSGLLALRSTAESLDIQVDHVAFDASRPDLQVERLEGGFAIGDVLELRDVTVETLRSALYADGTIDNRNRIALVDVVFRGSPLSGAELERFVPQLTASALTPRIDGSAYGPLDALHIDVAIDEPRVGAVEAALDADTHEPRRTLAGRITTIDLDLQHLDANRFPTTAITATVEFDLRTAGEIDFASLEGPVHLEGGEVVYGPYTVRHVVADGALEAGVVEAQITVDSTIARARATGRIQPPADDATTWSYAVEGRLTNADLARLPRDLGLPAVPTALTGDYRVAGRGGTADVTWQFGRSRVPGAVFVPGGLARVRFEDGVIRRYAFDGGVSDLDLERLGRAFGIARLADARLQSDLQVDLAAEGSGTRLDDLDLEATIGLGGSRIAGAGLSDFTATVRVSEGDVTVRAIGAFADLDLARVTARDDLRGGATGTLDLTASAGDIAAPNVVDRLVVDGRANVTDALVGDLRLDEAALDARYSGEALDIRTLDASGPALDLHASGRASLARTGATAVDYELRVTSLEEVGSIVDRPLSGSVALEGSITGNAAAYTTHGTLEGAPFAYGDLFDALDLEATYDARLEDLERVTAEAALRSVLPRISGREVRSLDVDLAYADQALSFETDVREDGRELTGAGRIVFHPDHQELHVQRLGLSAGDVIWEIAGDDDVAIQYRPDRLVVERFELASGPQTLSVAGVLSLGPHASSDLNIQVSRVDLEDLGALLLMAERRLAGRLDASATLSGTGDAPTARATVAIARGRIEDFAFESLSGRLDYAQEAARVDLTLQQAPGAALRASGSIPAAALGIGAAEGGTGRYDLRVNGAGMHLAAIGAVTDDVTEITGSFDVDLRVEGPAEAPQALGQIVVRNGAFRLSATGAPYEAVEAVARLSPKRIDVERLRILDEEGDALTATGGVGIEGGSLGAFQTEISATAFSVLDSDLGEVDIDATVRLEGEPSSPAIKGTVRVETGRLEIDEIFDALGPPDVDAPEAAEAADEESAGPFTGASLDLTIQVPDNLVVRGSEIRPPGGQFAIGDANVTLGGDFTVRKEPGSETLLVGAVNTVRGSYDFQGRRFEILRDGTVTFRGERPVDPALDVSAEREISGILARVNIGGTAREPTLSLSSTPPLDEGDVLALIVFNQPLNQLGSGDRASVGERAGALAAGFVASPISESIGQALDVDLFEIAPPEAAGAGPSVTLGEQVADRMFVRLRQQFGAQPVSEVMLEYRLSDFLRLEGSVAEGEGRANRGLTRRVERGGADVIVFFEY